MTNFIPLRHAIGLFAVLFICAPTMAIADIKNDIAVCAAKDNSVTRLDCFDKAAQKHKLVAQSRALKSPGKWNTRKKTSPVDDSESVFLWVQSDQVVSFGKYRESKPSLFVRCHENTTALYINYNEFLGSDDGYLTYRIDKEDAERVKWGISTDHLAIGIWRGNGAIPFIKRMFGKSHLLIRVEPYSESPVTTTFDITGLEKAIKPLRKACNW